MPCPSQPLSGHGAFRTMVFLTGRIIEAYLVEAGPVDELLQRFSNSIPMELDDIAAAGCGGASEDVRGEFSTASLCQSRSTFRPCCSRFLDNYIFASEIAASPSGLMPMSAPPLL